MKHKAFLLIFFGILMSSLAFAEDLSGFWQTLDKKTQKPNSVIAIYAYNGKYYGRIVATCNQQGNVQETLDKPQSKAPGVIGHPYYCWLDIVWACTPDNSGAYKGFVVDPQEGKKYNAKIWKENGNLILRGELFVFGRNEVLTPFPSEKFNDSFIRPNLASFTPKPCKIKG